MDGGELLVHTHHEDDEEDAGEDHFADGHCDEACEQGRSVADEGDQTEDLCRGRRGGAQCGYHSFLCLTLTLTHNKVKSDDNKVTEPADAAVPGMCS